MPQGILSKFLLAIFAVVPLSSTIELAATIGDRVVWRRIFARDSPVSIEEIAATEWAIFARFENGIMVNCRRTSNKKEVDALFTSIENDKSQQKTFGDSFSELKFISQRISECKKLTTSTVRRKRFLIAPGTDWCGVGHRSTSTRFSQSPADECCRQHDSCPIYIQSGKFKYNTRNYLPYTVSYCKCDHKFYECLKQANSSTADLVGRFFFNILDHDCFELERGDVCKAWHWWGTCSQQTLGVRAVFKESPAF